MIDKKTAGKLATETAKEMGYASAPELIDNLKMGVATKNLSATKTAGDFLNSLTLKVLKQELNSPDIGNPYQKFVSMFDAGELDAGNSKEFIFHLQTGMGEYDETKFIPTGITTPIIESQILSMMKKVQGQADTLTDYAFRYKKGISIVPELWLYYFINNKLSEFISQVLGNLKNTIYLKLFDKILNQIFTATPQKTITGTATNNFNAFTQEIFPEIKNMSYFTNVYNLSSESKYATTSSSDDLIMIMSNNNKVKYNAGILSQSFNAKYADFETYIKPENIIVPAKRFTIGDQDTAITFLNDEYIDDNTIYVLDKRNIKFMKQLDIMEVQNFSENLIKQNTLHFWGLTALLPQLKIFKYTNVNLSTAPAGE